MSMLLDNISKLEDINSHTNPIQLPPRYNCLKNPHTATPLAEVLNLKRLQQPHAKLNFTGVQFGEKHSKNDE